ncbi:hypothetical protein KW798_00540 [Candidatus Parcubacteria bacterium]|nr:hypothetical protein [Candidatus Parcubacteria bacterium]
MPEEKHITWEVKTHMHREHSTDWYWALGTFGVVGAGLSIWFGNGLLAIILLVGTLSIGVLAARGPRDHIVRIDTRGISIDGTMYNFSTIHSFWVERDGETPRLFLTTNSLLMPRVSLPLDSHEQGQLVRDHVRDFVKEEEQHPHMGEHLAEIFGL